MIQAVFIITFEVEVVSEPVEQFLAVEVSTRVFLLLCCDVGLILGQRFAVSPPGLEGDHRHFHGAIGRVIPNFSTMPRIAGMISAGPMGSSKVEDEILGPELMFAKHDKRYSSRSGQTSLAAAVTNITKPVTKINSGPSIPPELAEFSKENGGKCCLYCLAEIYLAASYFTPFPLLYPGIDGCTGLD